MPSKVKLGLIQMSCSTDPDANLRKVVGKVEEAAARGAQIVSTQELFRSQYFCQTENHDHFSLAEPIPGPSTEALCRVAKDKGVVIVGSLFEKRAPGIFHNTAVVIDADGKLLGKYRKMHIPDDPLYYEKFYFTPGDLGFRAFETRFGRIGVLVCWDQWFPEAARLTALAGAKILFYPTAIGWHPSEKAEFGERQRASWELIQRSHGVANNVFVASTNRVGHEGSGDGKGGIDFWGHSFISDPSGQILAVAGESEEILVSEIDLNAVEFNRVHWPFLRDRRIDAYGNLLQRYADSDESEVR
ncbi:MAG: carbon-nitrogen hydrolase [Verrucomicrobiae bacterium]|nr:carbon-nitrogen hydrolase [Verrucomicrobiae bacterium]